MASPPLPSTAFAPPGLEAIALAADRIRAGTASAIVAGGAESMSLVPFPGQRLAPNPWLVDRYPQIYLTMGLTAEKLAQKYAISREDQDAFALASHRKAVEAQNQGRFRDEIVPIQAAFCEEENGGPVSRTVVVENDEGPRPDTSLEALAALKPVFHAKGTVTAGNSSQSSDGASAALLMSASRAQELGLKPMARFSGYAVGGVPPEIMGIGPLVAIPKVLALTGLHLADIGLIELNEAFAVQALAVMRHAGLDPAITNVNGGAIALGHPLGATGAKLTATLLREMRRREVRYGMVTLCVGGGQGVAGIFERV